MNDWKEIDFCRLGEREARAAAYAATDETTGQAHLDVAANSARAWALLNKLKRPMR